jgi:drug/metabolite transporter (DMT)-like permease
MLTTKERRPATRTLRGWAIFAAYGRSIRELGASRAAVNTPVAVGLLGIPLLGEIPDGVGWIGIALVSAGVAFASAGPR